MPTKDEVMDRLNSVDKGTAAIVGGSTLAGVGAARAAKGFALKDWDKKSKGLRQQIGHVGATHRTAVNAVRAAKDEITPQAREAIRKNMKQNRSVMKNLTHQYQTGKKRHVTGRQLSAGLGVAALTAGTAALVRNHRRNKQWSESNEFE